MTLGRDRALIVFGVALGLRLLHLWQIHRSPFLDLKLGDASGYDAWARQIVAGDWLGRDVFYQAPLYPYFLALVYAALGTSSLTVRLVQAVLDAASCVLLADAGSRFFSQRTGMVAGLMLAFYPPAIFLDTLIQKSVLDLFFLCLALWLLARIHSEPRRSTWWLLGLALGCLILTRENAFVLIAPILLWLVFQRPDTRRERLGFAAVFLAGLAMVLLPVAVRNKMVGGELFVTTSQLGPNLYIGNNEQSDGTYQSLRPFRGSVVYERQDATDLAELALGRTLTPAEVSSYYTRRVEDFIRAQPGRWLRLLLKKFVLVWNVTEISDTEDQYTYAHRSWPLAAGLVWNLGVLAPAAVAGMWITAADWRRLWILHVMLATYVASAVMFYVFARYRFPIVPFLALFAAAGMTGLRAYLHNGTRLPIAGCTVVIAAVALLCNWPIVPKNKLEAVTHYNGAVGLQARGQIDVAIREYQNAVRLDPSLSVAHNDLGLLLGTRGQLTDAAAEFEDAVRLAPDYSKAHNNLGVIRAQQGRSSDALAQFEDAVRLDPAYVQAHDNLGEALSAQGRAEEATAEYERAIRLDPTYAEARRHLAADYVRRGRLADAAVQYRTLLGVAPRDVAARAELAAILGQMGQFDEAISEFQQALESTPDDASLRNRFAGVLARSGRLEAAAAQLRQAILAAPDRADLHNNLGIVLAQQGGFAAAATEFERALALAPGDAQTRRNLERLLGR